MFYKKAVFKTSQNSQQNTYARVSCLQKRLWQKCFPVNFAKFLRITILQNTSSYLLLQIAVEGMNRYWNSILGRSFYAYNFYFALTKILKFSVKDFFGNCDQIRRKLRIWSHQLKKPLTENFIFC